MKKRGLFPHFLLFLILFIVTIYFINGVYAFIGGGGGSAETQVGGVSITTVTGEDLNEILTQLEEAGRIGEILADEIREHIDLLSELGLVQLSEEQLGYTGEYDEPTINLVEDWNKLNDKARDDALSDIVGEDVDIDNPVNGKVVGRGIKFDSVRSLKIGKAYLTNADGVSYEKGNLKVKRADSLASGNIRFSGIDDTEFHMSDNMVEAAPKTNAKLKITDAFYNEYEFKGINANGKVAIDKGESPAYTIESGSLTNRENSYNESVEVYNSAVIETDKALGFKCLSIEPIGSYFYNDRDLRKDFIINIPREAQPYRLCLRKSTSQQFTDYNGLVDFVEKKVELDGIVSYLRYRLKNSQIASLLSDYVYMGLENAKALLDYDSNLLFLNRVSIKNTIGSKNTASITKPNNYYTIKEVLLKDGEVHRIVELEQVDKSRLSWSIAHTYESDSMAPKIEITDNILAQASGNSTITVIPPGHKKMNEMLEEIGKI